MRSTMRRVGRRFPALLALVVVALVWKPPPLHASGISSASSPPKSYKEYDTFVNRGLNKADPKQIKEKFASQQEKSKVDVLGELLKRHVEALRKTPNKQVELVFLVDSSASVGAENFFNELKFVKKLLADFTVEYNATRVALITFSSRNRVVKHVDHVSYPSEDNHKCSLLDEQLPMITYQGGGTYTLGAMLKAQEVLNEARSDATKAVFLVTDGYSNGGDPRPAAKVLRDQQVEIFTFGIQNGNIRELFDMASEPAEEHSYILDSFEEFEALARRALHEDLPIGSYLKQEVDSCGRLCPEGGNCCDSKAECTCGTHTGHYACVCKEGFYGTGLKGNCHACPTGTYRPASSPGDISTCIACPDINQVSLPGSVSIDQCHCKTGFQKVGNKCVVLECSPLSLPENGYFVNNVCSRVFNAACGIRCKSGYKLRGSSIRMCAENGTWTGEETTCEMKTCSPLSPPRHGEVKCTTKDNAFETECHFTCEPGYTLVGSKKRTCLAISLWDGLPALCRPVNCIPLKPLIQGRLVPAKCTNGKSGFGEVCSYECNEGFQLSGPPRRSCGDSGSWSDDEMHTVCKDIDPPKIKCPQDVVVDAEENEANSVVEWSSPSAMDNSGDPVTISVVPAIISPRRFDIGIATIVYTAEDRARNRARCNFTVTVRDIQPPVTDRCISPSIVLSRVLPVQVHWEEPMFSDNSGRPLHLWKSHNNPSHFPLGSTKVQYEVKDEAGNNNTCTIIITVQEHACAFPNDPINGHTNCTEAENGVFCTLSCFEGYGFAVRTPPFYYCAYDGRWQPEEFLPFPDCSRTFYSNTISKLGTVSVMSNGLSCDDSFLLEQLEKHLERKISNRVSRICRKSVICEVENMIAECEHDQNKAEEESNLIFRRKRQLLMISDQLLHRHTRGVPLPHLLAKSRAMKRNSTKLVRAAKIYHGKEIFDTSVIPNIMNKSLLPHNDDLEIDLLSLDSSMFSVTKENTRLPQDLSSQIPLRDLHSEEVLQNKIELEFQLTGKISEDSEEIEEQHSLVDSVQNAMITLEDAAHRGELDISLGNNRLHVEYVKFDEYEPIFVCDTGTISINNRCVKCPVGTFFNVVTETCEGCPMGTYQFQEGQFSCLVCPERTSTTTGQSKSVGECKAQCLPGSFSFTGLEPCETCPTGHYQPSYAQDGCVPCPPGTTTPRRGVRHVSECKVPCPPGSVSRIGLQPCFACPDGFFQPHKGEKSCFRCPQNLHTGMQGATNITACIGLLQDSIKVLLPTSAELMINDCFSVPCLNGATCEALEIGFLCTCNPGYSGLYCEVEVDECDSHPCTNGGTCQDEINAFRCFCPSGYSGDQCEQDIDDCINEPCYNGASCFDKINGFQCKCSAGFVGPLCQYNIDDCISNPCRNGGFCEDLIANYTCNCLPGFTSYNCEINIDDCANTPCKYNASCIDGIQSFQCQCLAGYNGTLCEVDIDECKPQPCMNGATCLDKVARFQCMCPPAYVGELCETELSSDFLLHFPSSGIVDFVQLDFLPRELDQLTICMWMITSDKINYGTPISYAAGDGLDNLLTLTDYSGFVFYINMEKVVTDVTANDGKWHHICITWSTFNGEWAIYKDGIRMDYGIGLAAGTFVPADGVLVLGQEQDKRGAGFSTPESFIGTLTLLNIWDYVFSPEEIAALPIRCDKYHGNVRSWPDFISGIRGKVVKNNSHFCSGCAAPIPPVNSEVSVSGVKTQAVASYSCNSGYEIEGIPIRRCLACGNWSDTDPQCVRINCGFPGYIANGYINGRQYQYQDSIDYVCNPGYRLIGESSRTCQIDKNWSGYAAHCEEIMCDMPKVAENRHIMSVQRQYHLNQRLQFFCDEGYELYGPSSLTCISDGRWNDTQPICQPKSCESPPRVPHGHVIGPQHTNFEVGSVVHYQCDEGFHMQEKGEINCELMNRWAGNLPRCEKVSCGAPVIVPHVILEGKDHHFGGTVIYKCDRGYELHGVSYSTCQSNRTWSGSPPECQPVSCPRLHSPDQGGIDQSNFTYGSVVKYFCHSGYELKGVRSRKCRATGEWSGESPTCVPVSCSQPESISNGRYMGSDWTVGNTVTYGCNPGYILIGEADRVCLESGQWLHEVPSCIPVECSDPKPIIHGTVRENGRKFGQRVTYSCDIGYLMLGHAITVCMEDQRWEPDPPECRPVSCGQLQLLENAQVFWTNVVFQGVANYTCSEGFRLEGSKSRYCQSNGQWSGQDPTCEVIRCPEPSNIAHAYLIYSDTRYGSVVEYYCDEGYKMQGPVQRLCTSDGQWSDNDPECVRVHCELPSSLLNGKVVVDDTSYNSIASYYCNRGYELVGPSYRTCLYDETWSGGDPTCTIIRCSIDNLSLNDGHILGDTNVVGSTIQYECNTGFYLVGTETRVCREDRQWSGSSPHCVRVQCPVPVAPENGEVVWRGHSFEDTLTYSCLEGYTLTGDNIQSCLQDGTWSDIHHSNCMPVECEVPPHPENGHALVESLTFSSHVEYTCNSGFRLKGPQKRICKSDRTWSDEQPSCQIIICLTPPIISFGYHLQRKYPIGAKAEYKCDEGFKLMPSNKSIICNSQGRWNGHPPHCDIITCPTPQALQFGYVEGNNFTFGNSVNFICNVGWLLIGSDSATCDEFGNWSSPFPTCQGTLCPTPHQIKNGYVSSSDFSFGAIIFYKCFKGFEIVGTAKQICKNDNTWSAQSPLCIPVICNPPQNVTHATIHGNIYEYEKSVIYTCDSGYELHGANSLTCQETGFWSSDPPVCEQISCPLPDPLLHGEVLVDSFSQGASGRAVQIWPVISQRGDITVDGKSILEASRSDIFHLGDRVAYRCTYGYVLAGRSIRTCEANGLWSEDIPHCEPISCQTPENLFMGDVFVKSLHFGSIATYNCDPGYKIMGSIVRECQANSTWSLELPTCIPIVCPMIQDIPHGYTKWTSLRYGATATYECATGYRMVGRSVRICENSGIWSNNEPTCIPRECGTPASPENGWVETEGHIVGSIAMYHCYEGYEITDPAVRTCLANESWSLEIAKCNIISCLHPPAIKHGYIQGTNYSYTSIIHYKCDEGYHLEGESKLKCLFNKTWHRMIPKCVPLPCTRPNAPNHGTVLFRDLVVGSTVQFSCTDGYEIEGSRTSSCLSNQTWYPDSPQCSIISCPPLKSIKHGEIIGQDYTYKSMISFYCNDKYKLDGPTNLFCTAKGNWSKLPPHCHRYLCDMPETPNNADFTLGPYVVGQDIDYSCHKGFILKGNKTLHCDYNGHWQGIFPKCNPISCGKPPDIPHSRNTNEGEWVFGGKVKYTCDANYELKGNNITCSFNGSWSPAPVCQEITCSPPPLINYASVVTKKNPGVITAIYTCHSGYKLTGVGKHVCFGNSLWNITGTSCEPVICGKPPSIAFGAVTSFSSNTVGSRIRYECFPGYRIVGSTTVECSWQGAWEGKPPLCVPITCPFPTVPDHGLLKGDDFSFQSAVLYSCIRGYQLYGRDTMFCLEDGSWSGETPLCRKISCTEIDPPHNGYIIQDAPGQFGDRIRFSCYKGYQIIGSDSIKCLDTGEWDKHVPRCSAVTCQPLKKQPANTIPVQLKVGNFKVGDKIPLACEAGFVAHGDVSMQCLPNSSWSFPSGTCKKVSCGRLKLNNGAILLGMSFQFRDHLVVLCPPGSRRKGKSILTCLGNGQWDAKPTCEGMCQRPCLNGGVCIPPGLCSCPSGYVGDVCQYAVCILPCLNGGICVGPYTCTCMKGFSGSRCQTALTGPRELSFHG